MSYWNDPTKIWDLPYNGVGLKQGPPVQLAYDGAGSVTTGSHKYKITCVDGGGETLAGEASDAVVTDTGSNGKVLVRLPDSSDPSVTGFHIYGTAAGGSTFKKVTTGGALSASTYKGKWYLVNIADGSLGANEPSSNSTTTPIDDPPIGRDLIEALTAGALTNFLVAYFVVQWRWVMQTSAGYNAAVLAPGTWAYMTTGEENRWYRGDYEWSPTSEPSGTATIPSYSTSLADVQDILVALDRLGIPMTIEYGELGYPSHRVITVISGAKTFTAETEDDDDVPLLVCKIALMAACDVAA